MNPRMNPGDFRGHLLARFDSVKFDDLILSIQCGERGFSRCPNATNACHVSSAAFLH